MIIYRLFIILIVASNIATTQSSILIKNGKILDGTGNTWFFSDVLISEGFIRKISKNLDVPADLIIDAKGQIVAPGFIDVHGHIEGGIQGKPTADNYIYDGVTTVVTGNCGNSSDDLNAFFKRLDSTGISINVASLVGHNTVRGKILKMENRAPSLQEQAQMEILVEEGMKSGAVGFSTGLIYVPGTYSNTEELIRLARQSAKFSGLYVSHIRDEGDSVHAAIDEAIRIGKEAGLPVEISHFKITGKHNWGS